MPADSGRVGLFTVQPMGPQPHSCTPERGVKVPRWVLATPQLLVGFAIDNNWCGSRFSGQWSQQGWPKDHRGLCLDKGTADMVWCGCANILGVPPPSWDSWGQDNREKVTLLCPSGANHTPRVRNHTSAGGERCLGICDPLLLGMGFSWFLLAK